jgi:2-keto-4-pentenoate hydratase
VTDVSLAPQKQELPDRAAAHAALLHRARSAGQLLDAATEVTGLTMEQSYSVQEQLTATRLAEGRTVVGYKLGYTSAVMRRQMGVDAPNFGPLLDDMVLHDGDCADHFLQPRVEPEIGVVLRSDLAGDGLLLHEVADAVAEVRACMEVVDSIWRDYRFSAEQNTSDGSSAAGVVVGPTLDVEPLQCHRVPVELLEDGCVLATATSAAAGGHPLSGLVWLSAQLALRGRGLRAGELIITGGLTSAVPLHRGTSVEAVFGGRRSVRLSRS